MAAIRLQLRRAWAAGLLAGIAATAAAAADRAPLRLGDDDRILVLAGGDDERALLDDSRLGVSDLRDRGPKNRRVVEIDWGEHRHLCVGDIRGIPLAAHSDLNNSDLDWGIREGEEGEHRKRLKEGDGALPRVGQLTIHHCKRKLQVGPGGNEPFVTNRLAVNLKALGEIDEVRAREETRAQPVGAQKGFCHAAG